MLRAAALAILTFLASPAHAQQSAAPLRDCAVLPTSRENPTIGNKCKQAIYVEFFDLARNTIIEGELKPGQVMQAPLEAFGAVCPTGFRSSVPLMLVNRQIFAKDMYGCIRR
jgi:hypothetical protein